MFSNQQQGTSGNLFNNQGGSGSNLFSNNQSSGNLFGQSGSMVGAGTQYGSYGGSGGYGGYGQGMSQNPNFSQVNEEQFRHLLSSPQDQQKKLFEAFQSDYIKNLMTYYRKTLEPSKIEKLQLSKENPLANERISKVAANMNIKKEIIQVKRL